ncbi:MAG: hypothetical protein HUU21_11560 [Polyangiaceae bacterium]|nr:hypothetical protein [Polyangiaceae bacterium]
MLTRFGYGPISAVSVLSVPEAMLTRFGYGPISTVSVLSVPEYASAPRPPRWARILCD